MGYPVIGSWNPKNRPTSGTGLVLLLLVAAAATFLYAEGSNYAPYIEDFSHGSPESEQALATARMVCDAISYCASYTEALKDCAAAGNIDRCVHIKLGGLRDDGYLCEDDGSAVLPTSKRPDRIACVLSSTGRRR
jgi:hypothetical protein